MFLCSEAEGLWTMDIGMQGGQRLQMILFKQNSMDEESRNQQGWVHQTSVACISDLTLDISLILYICHFLIFTLTKYFIRWFDPYVFCSSYAFLVAKKVTVETRIAIQSRSNTLRRQWEQSSFYTHAVNKAVNRAIASSYTDFKAIILADFSNLRRNHERLSDTIRYVTVQLHPSTTLFRYS